MTGISIVPRFAAFPNPLRSLGRPALPPKHPDLHTLWPQASRLPALITAISAQPCATWSCWVRSTGTQFPERDLQRNWGQTTIPYAAFAAACLVKLEDTRHSMGDLRTFLVDQPLLIWLLGFPLAPAPQQPYGFDAQASLPTERHFTRLLRTMPNAVLQFLLADSVRLILAELTVRALPAPQCISLDTKHIIAWVKENNPKQYVEDRFDKSQAAQRRSRLSVRLQAPPQRSRRRRPHSQRRPRPIPSRPPRSRSASSTGAMAPASSWSKCLRTG